MKLKIGVIFGSKTCEHDVSVISGLQAAQALDRQVYDVTIIYIDRAGAWYIGDALNDVAFYRNFDASKVTRVIPAGANGKLVLMASQIKRRLLFSYEELAVLAQLDVLLPVMHGMNGEDGTLQGMLELFDVPHTSAGVLGASVGMDKIAMKLLFMGCGFPVVPGTWFNRARWSAERGAVLDEVEQKLGYPVYVKPANLGSSIGISRADDREGLEEAIDTACAYDRRILVEKGVVGMKEVNCSVLGYGDDVQTSALEMPLGAEDFLSFEGKYLRGEKESGNGMQSSARQIPAPIPDEMAEEIRQLSLAIFEVMDLKGVVRIDYIIDADGELFVNEANVIPGSLAFYLWEPEGVSFAQMLEKMIESALRANAEKRQSIFSYDSTILSNIIGGSKAKETK